MKIKHAIAKRSAPRSPAGFTLIELMIVVVIVAILAALAVSAYGGYVARSKRAEARNQLLQAAQFMQQFYSANDSYATDRSGNAIADEIPPGLMQSPADGAAIYTLAPPTLTTTGYALMMTPVSSGSMAADSCGAFTVTSTGVRGIVVGGAVGSSDQRDTCWK